MCSQIRLYWSTSLIHRLNDMFTVVNSPERAIISEKILTFWSVHHIKLLYDFFNYIVMLFFHDFLKVESHSLQLY